MNVTPLDIRRKEFKRSLRGYADEEVDIFLDEVADEFERLFQDNAEMSDRLQRLEEQLESHAQMKTALEKTLVSAQLQADQMTANARKESELIMRDAELQARNIVSESYAETQRVQQALVQLKHLEEDFRFKFRLLLEAHLKLLGEAPIVVPAAEAAAVLAPATVTEPAATDEALRSPMVEPSVAGRTERGEETSPLGPPPVWTEAVPQAKTEFVSPPPVSLDSVPAEAAPPEASEAEAAAAAIPAEESPILWPEDEDEAELEPAEALAEGEVEVARLAALAAEDIPTQETEAPDVPSVDGSDRDVSASSADERGAGQLSAAASDGDGSRGEEEVRGFFFGKPMEDVDDSFVTFETPKKDNARDFEW
jgi:cell division initiation protein